jgi:hypothetical protein
MILFSVCEYSCYDSAYVCCADIEVYINSVYMHDT